MASYNGHELFVEKSSRDGRLFTPEEQESDIPFIEGSDCVDTTEEEIKAGVEYYKKYRHCKIHMFYDEQCLCYYRRKCGICGTTIGMI